jgi:sugar-specific transcriptional regulator TrmB
MNIEDLFTKLNYEVYIRNQVKGISGVTHELDYMIKKADKTYTVFLTKKEELQNTFLKSYVLSLDTKIQTLILVTDNVEKEEIMFYKNYNPNVKVFENINELENFLKG